MNNSEYKEVLASYNAVDEIISAEDLGASALKDHTLLYGYTCLRETFHVYLKNKEIHVIIYKTDYSDIDHPKPMNMREINVTSNTDYIPDKRVYPETCDYLFCMLLAAHGILIPFTSFNGERPKKDFYGFTLEDA